MRWYYVFVKGIREQVRDYWILLMILVMAPLFIFLYFLMEESEHPTYEIVVVNQDTGYSYAGFQLNLGDSLVTYASLYAHEQESSMLQIRRSESRESAMEILKSKKADVGIVLPVGLTKTILNSPVEGLQPVSLELIGDITNFEYIVGAVWIEELVNEFVLEASGIHMPVTWKETTLGYSGQRTTFELYVPGLLILSIIMIIFSASAAIVREPETRTLERLNISRLSALEFLGGISMVQLIIAMISLALALLTAVALGYTVIPGTIGFILLISFLTALSMIAFSLIVAAMCRSIKEVAIIGTFPLFLLMFFTGAAFPISGGKLFEIGNYTVRMNDILSPKFSVQALNKVLVRGQEISDTVPDMIALLILTLIYLVLGTWAFRRRHMRAR